MAGLLHRVRYTGSECDGLKLFQALLTHVLPPKLRYAPAAVAENAVGPEFSQDNGCAVHIDLQRITLGNIQRAPQLYGQDDASQLICLCQVESKNFKKPLYIKGFRTFDKINPCVIITQKQHKSQQKAGFYMVMKVERQHQTSIQFSDFRCQKQ